MSEKLYLTHDHVFNAARTLAELVKNHFILAHQLNIFRVYAVPRGGIPAAYSLNDAINCQLVDKPEDAHFIVDDLIDSGATQQHYKKLYPTKPFFALFDKTNPTSICHNKWVVFPWERTEAKDESATDNITRILQYVGEDPTREGLLETPARVMKAWGEWTSGYKLKAEDILKVFEDGAEGCDQMVVRKDIPIYSHCEHHLASIFGKCTIAYIPKNKIVGLSKMDRIADMFARRLQVQERLTNQIADAMWKNLDPIGVGVWISARHMCVESRGVCNANSETVTVALRGAFKDQPETRSEFLALART